MSSPYSVYAVNEAVVPQELAGEDYAAISAHAMTLLLVVGINVHIHHLFHRRKGLYSWAVQIGSLGCFFAVSGSLMRNFVRNSVRVWPLYTLLATVGWTIYTVTQLVVPYSRLHLVVRNETIQCCVFTDVSPADQEGIQEHGRFVAKDRGPPDLEKSLPPSPQGGVRLLWKNKDDEPEEEVNGLHGWERRAKPVLEVPWLPRQAGGQV